MLRAIPGQGGSVQSTVSWPVFRRFVCACAAGVALAATSGCTVPADAVAGISVTDDGRLLGVMMVCGHRIDGATLYVDSPGVDSEVTVGSWGSRPTPHRRSRHLDTRFSYRQLDRDQISQTVHRQDHLRPLRLDQGQLVVIE